MGEKISAFFLILLLLPVAFASPEEDISELSGKVEAFIDVSNENNLIIIGEHASTTEKLALEVMKKQNPNIANAQTISEEEFAAIDSAGKTLIFIGGPMQSKLAASYLENEQYIQTEDPISYGKVIYLESEQGKVMVFTDHAGIGNLPKTALEKSPFANFMPMYMIPVAATATGLLLLIIGPFLIKFFLKMFSFMASSKLMSKVTKKELKKEYIGIKIGGVRFKLREWLSILIAASVFAASLGYLYLSPSMNILFFLILTIVVNFIVYGIRHLTRLYLDKRHKLHTEYTIWIWGALITALTAWLGNVFALAGYLMKSSDTEDEAYQGRIAFIVNLVTFSFFIVLFILNLNNPNIVFQMVFLLALAITYLQMLPFKPFDGQKVYAWKSWLWWICFIPLTVVYVLVNLVL